MANELPIDHAVLAKQAQRKKLEEQVRAYLAKGGSVRTAPPVT